jgi:hypothetical protein
MMFVAWGAELETIFVDQGDSGETELELCADNAAYQQANTLVQTRLYYWLSGVPMLVIFCFACFLANKVEEDKATKKNRASISALTRTRTGTPIAHEADRHCLEVAIWVCRFVMLAHSLGWAIYLIVEIVA